MLLQLQPYLVTDRLDITLVGAGADDEIIRKRGDPGQIQDLDIGSLFGFGGANGQQPGCGFR
jgi:hypothetical protein